VIGSTQTTGRGFTLLETLIVATIAAVILGVTMALLQAGLGTSQRSATQGEVQEEARRTVEAIAREMKDSSEASAGWMVGANPSPYAQYYDTDVSVISFSRCVGYDTTRRMMLWGAPISYAFTPPSGSEPGKLTRAENGVQVSACDHVTAFTAHYDPNDRRMILSLTVERPDPNQASYAIRADCVKQVRLRN
jgi:prepilin-type N-terminal cleavage/methylation domain-containing protein